MKVRTKTALIDYCRMFGIDEAEATTMTEQAITHYKGVKPAAWITVAKDEWYDLLREEGEANYSLYNDFWYFCELLACYDIYSSEYISLLTKLPLTVESVLDLGCGLGITSTHLAEVLGASVVGTNLKGTMQYEFCETHVKMCGDYKKAGHADMVFASEYFEHIHTAGDHLIDIIEYNNPRVIVMANAFNAESLGHFEYFYNGGWSSKAFPCDALVAAKDMGRLFAQILKGSGFSKMDTGFWNSRPNVWTR